MPADNEIIKLKLKYNLIKMKKYILVAALALFCLDGSAKKKTEKPQEGFVFTTVKENPITSIKDQNRSSTCWNGSGL